MFLGGRMYTVFMRLKLQNITHLPFLSFKQNILEHNAEYISCQVFFLSRLSAEITVMVKTLEMHYRIPLTVSKETFLSRYSCLVLAG